MKAAVAVPPLRDFYRTRHRHSALGAGIAVTLLESCGVETSFFNFPVQGKNGTLLPLPEDLDYLSPFLLRDESGGVSFFTGYRRFGPPESDCADSILRSKPDLVFLSCFAFCYARESLQLAREIRKRAPEIPVIAGGAGASAFPGWFIRTPWIDAVFSGEIERALPRFIHVYRRAGTLEQADLSSVPGLHFRGGCSPPDSPPPLPGFRIIRETHQECRVALSVTRGCPKRCRFCSVHLSQGDPFRTVDLSTVEVLLASLPKEKHLVLNFEDDNLLADREYALEIFDLVSHLFPGAELKAENGVDYMLLTEAFTEKLIRAGFKQFNLSLGAFPDGNGGTAEHAAGRPADLSHYEAICSVLERHGIPLISYIICGLASDSLQSVTEALLYLYRQNTLIGISLFYPVPGLEGFRDTTVFDTVPPSLCAGSSVYPWNGSLSTGQMITAFRLARFLNLLKKKKKSDTELGLVRTTLDSHRLHTLRGTGTSRRIEPVPHMDETLQEQVLSTVSY